MALVVHNQDPTQTATLRLRYSQAFGSRWAKVKKAVTFNIIGPPGIIITSNADPRLVVDSTNPDRVAEQMILWLSLIEDQKVLEVARAGNGEVIWRSNWQNPFVRQAYLRGIRQANLYLRSIGVKFTEQTISELIADPFYSASLRNLFESNYLALQTVKQAGDNAIAITIRDVLVKGYAEGQTNAKIARNLNDAIKDRIGKISLHRSRMIARTEIISAHAEATLDSFEKRGILEVRAEVELLTAMDSRVCPICSGLEGQTFTIAAARGVIPVHPLCRCTWLPVV